jgi:long-chain acyl-CoA synthetase
MKELVYHRLFLPGLDAFGDTADTIIDGEYRSTLGEHGDRVFRLAHGLRHQLGVQPGDRVAVMSTNSHQYLELYHACFLGAAVVNPLNLRLAGKELDYIIRDSGTEVVFVDGFFGAAIAAAMAQSDAGSTGSPMSTTWRRGLGPASDCAMAAAMAPPKNPSTKTTSVPESRMM